MVVYSAAKIGFISELIARERAFLSCGLYIFANRLRSFCNGHRLHSGQCRHRPTLRMFSTAMSAFLMKLRGRRRSVGDCLRFPPRFHAYVRAIYAHISWFSFFAFTPSPTYRNIFILNQLGVKAFDPKPSRSTSSPVLLRGGWSPCGAAAR